MATRCEALRKITTGRVLPAGSLLRAEDCSSAPDQKREPSPDRRRNNRCGKPLPGPGPRCAHDLHQIGGHTHGQLTGAQHHHLRHSSGQWQHHPEGRALPGLGRRFDAATQGVDFGRTTSMPMPRPDKPVTSVAVLKPGMKIRLAAASSLSSSSVCSRPCATAFHEFGQGSDLLRRRGTPPTRRCLRAADPP